jgi:hypothetical protein
MIADPSGSSTPSRPGNADAGAVIEQRSAGRVWWWIDQQFRCNNACLYPAVSIARPVTFSVTPPRKLTRRPFASLVDDATGCCGKMLALCTIEYRPSDRHHAAATFSTRFPVQRKGKASMFVLQVSSMNIIHVQGRNENKQS